MKPVPKSALDGRVYPIGDLVGVNEERDLLVGKTPHESVALRPIIGPITFARPIVLLLIDLFGEMNLLRAIVKEMMRRDGTEICDANEHHRRAASLAHKIGYDVDSLRAVTDPLVRELAEEMIQPRQPSKEGLHRNRRQQS